MNDALWLGLSVVGLIVGLVMMWWALTKEFRKDRLPRRAKYPRAS